MDEVRIYNQSKAQIEPPVEGTVYADDHIQKVIDGSFLYYVDTGKSYVVSKIRGAWTGGTTPRTNQYIAVYQGPSVEQLFTKFAESLNALENSPNWDTIETPTDDGGKLKYQYPWIIQNNHSKNLCDLGLELGEQTSILKILEEDDTLDLGLTSHAAAAATLAYLANEVDDDLKIGISPSGRSPGMDFADVVLKPGSTQNFEPLSDATKTKIQTRFEELEETIVNYYNSTFEDALSSLLNDNNFYFWEQHAELLRIENTCLEDRSHSSQFSAPQTNHGSRICEVISAIKHGEVIDNKYDLAQISGARARSELRDSAGKIQNAINEHEQTAEKRSQRFFDDILSDVDQKPRAQAYNAVNTMLTIVTDSNQTSTASRTVRRFTEFYGWLTEEKSLLNSKISSDKNKLLTQYQISKLDIKKTLQNKLKEYTRAEHEDIFTEFENWIKKNRVSRVRHYRQLETFRNAIESSSQRERRSIDINRDLSNTINRLYNNEILAEQNVKEIESDVIKSINKEESQITKEHVENKNEKIVSLIDQTISTTSNPLTKFDKLRAIELCLKSNKNAPTAQHNITRIENFVAELDDDPILNQKQIKDIREHGQHYIEDQYPNVRKDLKENLLTKITDLLDQIPFENVPVAIAGQDLKILKQRTATGNKSTGTISQKDKYINEINDHIFTVITGEAWNVPYFNSNTNITSDEVLNAFHEKINSRFSDLRKQYKNEIISEFDDTITRLNENTNISTYWYIILLDDLLDRLNRSHNKSIYSHQLNKSINEYFPDEIEPFYTHVEKINENNYSILKYNDVSDIQNRLESLLTQYLSEARNKFADTVTNQIKQEMSDMFILENLQSSSIEALVDTKNSLTNIDNNIQSIRQNRSQSIDLFNFSEEALNAYRVLDSNSQNSVLGEISEWIAENDSQVSSKLSSKIHRNISEKLHEIENSSDTHTTKLRRYSQFCNFSHGDNWELRVSDSYSSAISGNLLHLSESDYNEIRSRLEAKRQASLTELRKNIRTEFEAALDHIETEVDSLRTALNSLGTYITGEKTELTASHYEPAVEIVDDIEALYDDGVISYDEKEKIHSDLLNMISERKDIRDKIPGVSVQTIFAAALVGVVLIAIAAVMVVPTGQQPSNADQFTVSSVIIQQDDSSVRLSGRTSETDRVGITLVGSGEDIQRRVAVTDGTFETRFIGVSQGEYDLFIHPPGNESAGKRIRTNLITRSDSPSPFTTLLANSSKQGLTIAGTSSINGSSLDFQVSAVQSSNNEINSTKIQINRTVPVADGEFSFLLANASSGTYDIQVQQHNESLAREITLTVPDKGEFRYSN